LFNGQFNATHHFGAIQYVSPSVGRAVPCIISFLTTVPVLYRHRSCSLHSNWPTVETGVWWL